MQSEVAIVTGGVSGVGCAPGERLARWDSRLAVVGLNAAAAQPLAGDIRSVDEQASAGDAVVIMFDHGVA